MNRLPRVIAMLVVLALVAPEIRREQAERQLAQATARIDPVLRGDLQGAPAVAAAADAATLAAAAARALPGDPRPPLPGAIAAMLLGRTDVAVTLLDAAIDEGERPEFTVNLGRARAMQDDMAGADRAYLRSAWASELALATLPAAMRDDLLARVRLLEAALHRGTLDVPPPLD